MTEDERAQAACLGIWKTNPKLFKDFWDEQTYSSRANSLALCQKCPVQEACLESSLENKETHGVWGGAGRRERERIAKARR